MFESEVVGVRIGGIAPQQMEHDDAEVALVVLSCEVSPLTARRAAEVHDIVKRTLFTKADAEENPLVTSVGFNLSILPQIVEVRMAPDQAEPSFVIDEAKISDIKASRSKKHTAWTLHFKITCSPQSDHQLAQIFATYTKMQYLTFSQAEPDLFSVEGEERRKTRRAAAASESATAH